MPIDGKDVRLFRAGMLANILSNKGFQVTWWNADFYHQKKVKRNLPEKEFLISNSLRIIALDSIGYSKSISIKRLIDHSQLANQFEVIAPIKDKPDIILCAFPTIDLCSKVVQYGIKNRVPVIIDIRDIWPDIFLERIFPNAPNWIGEKLLYFFNKKVEKSFNKAYSLVSVSAPMLNWGARKLITIKDNKVFPFGYYSNELSPSDNQKVAKELDKFGIFDVQCKMRICLFATLNNSFDIETIIRSAKNFKKTEVQFVICGSGEQLESYRELSSDIDNIFFPGWVNQDQITFIMDNSSVGLAPYINSVGFKYNLTNKPIEYMSKGLVILTCLKGYLKDLLVKSKCGFYYEQGSDSDLTRLIQTLLSDPIMLNSLRKNSKDLFNNQFNADHIYNEMINYFKKVAREYK